MDSKRTFSGILQIVLGAGILAAGGILFYQKLTNGGPEKLSLKYTCESFRAIKEAQTVAQEQSLKLEKMLNLQLLQSRAAIENPQITVVSPQPSFDNSAYAARVNAIKK